jgi:hypothetical protein
LDHVFTPENAATPYGVSKNPAMLPSTVVAHFLGAQKTTLLLRQRYNGSSI